MMDTQDMHVYRMIMTRQQVRWGWRGRYLFSRCICIQYVIYRWEPIIIV